MQHGRSCDDAGVVLSLLRHLHPGKVADFQKELFPWGKVRLEIL